MGVSEKEVSAQLGKAMKRGGSSAAGEGDAKGDSDLPIEACAELDILAAVISNPCLCKEVVESNVMKLYAGVLTRIAEEIDREGDCSVSALSDMLERRAMSYISRSLLNQKEMPTSADVQETICGLEIERLKKLLKQRNAEAMVDKENTPKLQKQISDIKCEIIELEKKLRSK